MHALELKTGQHIDGIEIVVSPGMRDAYNALVGDTWAWWAQTDALPPTLLLGMAFRSLLDYIHLPAGTIHLSQELKMQARAPVAAAYTFDIVVTRASVRQDQLFLFLELHIRADAHPVARAVTSLLIPLSTAEEPGKQ